MWLPRINDYALATAPRVMDNHFWSNLFFWCRYAKHTEGENGESTDNDCDAHI